MTVEDWREKLVDVARSVIDGQRDFITGIRELNLLRMESPDHEEEIFLRIMAIASELDGVPSLNRRDLYSADYLARMDASVAAYIPRIRQDALDDCQRIIDRYS